MIEMKLSFFHMNIEFRFNNQTSICINFLLKMFIILLCFSQYNFKYYENIL